MRRPCLALVPLLALAAAAPALSAQCAFSAERTASLAVTGARLAHIQARAGTLRIQGATGLREIRARGRACASSPEALEALQLRAELRGDEAWVSVAGPNDGGNDGGDRQYAYLDLVVEVPETLALDVKDSSGDLEIRQVAALDLQDSSGDVLVSYVHGSLRIDDSSGNVTAEHILGDVRLSDSSGDLTVRDVTGSVTVEQDSSGDIDLAEVTRDATVRDDSSGDIEVSTIGGSFTVDHDGSGTIRYRDVAGRVQIPEPRRARNR